jgi:hypothetical protein
LTSLFFAVVFLKDARPRHFKIAAISEDEATCLFKMGERMKDVKRFDFLIVNYMTEDAGTIALANWLDSLGFPKDKALGVISGLGDAVKRLCS